MSDEGITLKQLEKHGCVLSTVATDALVQRHLAISSADWIFIIFDQFIKKYSVKGKNVRKKGLKI